jgi:hypothetical protein
MIFRKHLFIASILCVILYIIINSYLFNLTYTGKTIKLKLNNEKNTGEVKTDFYETHNQSINNDKFDNKTSNSASKLTSISGELTISKKISSTTSSPIILENYKRREVLTSKCPCRSEKIIVEEYNTYYNVKILNSYQTIVKLTYNLSKEEYNSINCDLYNVLRRGKNQKVIGYSLYGKERRYYNQIFDNVELAEKRYPTWIIRVHVNDSVIQNISCKVECHQNRQQNNSYYDNVDFCHINKLPNSFIDQNHTWNANYTHAMSWRW